jgi:hypothetical protein
VSFSSRRGRGAGEPCPPRPRLYSALFDPGRVLDEAALDFLNRGCLSPASTSRKTAQPVHFARRAPPTLRGGSTPHPALSPGTQRDMDRARLMNSTARPQRRQRHGIPTSAQSPSLEGVPRSRASPTSPHFGGQFASVRRLKHGARAQPVPFSRRRRAADLARLVRVVPCSSRRRSWATRPGALTWGRPHGAQSTIHAACAIGSPRTSSVIRADARVGNDQFLSASCRPRRWWVPWSVRTTEPQSGNGWGFRCSRPITLPIRRSDFHSEVRQLRGARHVQTRRDPPATERIEGSRQLPRHDNTAVTDAEATAAAS